jgi:iron complex outermembrane receptor protein
MENIPDPITPDDPRNLTSSTGTFIGVYLQDLVTITDQIKFLAGVRYDNANQRSTFSFVDPTVPSTTVTRSKVDEGVFTPRAGLVYQPFPWIAFYGSYSKSFVPLEGTTRAGSALRPETGEQYEGGVKFDFFGGRITSTLAGYYLTKQNVAATDPVSPQFSVQIGEQRSRGFEFDLAGEVFPGFRLITSYAFTDAKIIKSTPLFGFDVVGNRRANVPKNSGTLWGTYDFHEGASPPRSFTWTWHHRRRQARFRRFRFRRSSPLCKNRRGGQIPFFETCRRCVEYQEPVQPEVFRDLDIRHLGKRHQSRSAVYSIRHN